MKTHTPIIIHFSAKGCIWYSSVIRTNTKNCCSRVKYQRLNETTRKYSNLTLFSVLLIVIAVRSPCATLIRRCSTSSVRATAGAVTFSRSFTDELWGRIMARILLVRSCVLCFSRVVTEPFEYSILDIEKEDDQHIRLSAFVSSVSKITCALNSSDSDPAQMAFEEQSNTRFYVRTKQKTPLTFYVEYLRASEQRLFCKISGLLYDPYHVEYFKSQPLQVSCSGLGRK